MNRALKTGFTLVEMIVVIAVIGILVSIVSVMYMGMQEQAEDTAVRDAADKFADAIEMHAVKYTDGKMPYGGTGSTATVGSTGCTSGAGGYQAYGVSGVQCTLGDAMIAAGYLKADMFDKLPANAVVTGGTAKNDFITADCGGTNYLFYYQQTPDDTSLQKVTDLLTGACLSKSASISGRGMGGVIKLDVDPV